jgi:hypothetical protein
MCAPELPFNSLFDLLEAFPTEKSCIKYLELYRWKDGIPVSPYEPTSIVYNRGGWNVPLQEHRKEFQCQNRNSV